MRGLLIGGCQIKNHQRVSHRWGSLMCKVCFLVVGVTDVLVSFSHPAAQLNGTYIRHISGMSRMQFPPPAIFF